MNRDVLYLILLAISAAIFTVFFCPFLDAHHLAWVCVVYYIVVVVTFLLGQSALVIRRRRER